MEAVIMEEEVVELVVVADEDDDDSDEIGKEVEPTDATPVTPERETQSDSAGTERISNNRSRSRKKRKKEDEEKEWPFVGLQIRKDFDGDFYQGIVTAGPERRKGKDGRLVCTWRVKYEDNDYEDLTPEELKEWVVDHHRHHDDEDGDDKEESSQSEQQQQYQQKPAAAKRKGPPPQTTKDYKTAKMDLMYRMGVSKEEVEEALEQMDPPYGLNKAMQLIHQAKKAKDLDPSSYLEEEGGKFKAEIGLRIRKYYDGSAYHGTVTKDAEWRVLPDGGEKVKMWEVTFDDGDTTEDMEFLDLFRWRASRPLRMHPVRGRQLCCLELFSGCGTVTQEFCDRKWRVRSMDSSPFSYATDKLDIMKLTYEQLGMVPDFIWASPPCLTYSNMAGGKHRSPEKGEFEKTPEANEHNRLLAQLFAILKWARSKNPHLIIAMENPVGTLRKMPLMAEIVKEMGLYETLINYCAWGRDDKKPTYIWTNDFKLHGTLSEFKCNIKCPYHGRLHPIGARANGHEFNASQIPIALAEEVAEHVHSTFYERRIRYTKEPDMSPEEVEEFDRIMTS